MILLFDAGNTLVKWRLLDDDRLVGNGARPHSELAQIPQDVASIGTPIQVWVASVAGVEFEQQLEQLVQASWSVAPWFACSEHETLGLKNSYREPQRMGVDRWLAMLSGWCEIKSALCVVDAGSALTIDFVSEGGLHEGGYILPGLGLMEAALLKDTDRVRFNEAPRAQLTPGTSTETAVFNGLLLSQVGAVWLALSRHSKGVVVIYTGGDGALLQRVAENEGEYRENMVLDGLLIAGQAR